MNYYLTIGRIPDHETVVKVFRRATKREALKAFERELYTCTDTTKAEMKRTYGQLMFITCIAKSTRPIKILESE